MARFDINIVLMELEINSMVTFKKSVRQTVKPGYYNFLNLVNIITTKN